MLAKLWETHVPPKRIETQSAPPADGLRDRLSSFLNLIRPYKEVAGLFLVAITSISGAVAFGVSYFATRSQLEYLECRMLHNLRLQSINSASFEPQIDWRMSQIMQIAQQPQNTETRTLILQYRNEIDDFPRKQTAIMEDAKRQLSGDAARCLQATPSTEQTAKR